MARLGQAGLAARAAASGPSLGARAKTPHDDFPMRAAGLDLGTVRVGLAVADELGLLAHPRPHLNGRDPDRLLEALAELVADEGIDVFVVGLPRTLRGDEATSARRARGFAERLRVRTGARVELVDERLSSEEARRRLRAQGLSERHMRDRIDSAAAALLLQSWLDGRRLVP